MMFRKDFNEKCVIRSQYSRDAFKDHSNFCSTLIIKNSCSGTRPFLPQISVKSVPANLRERNLPPKKFHSKKNHLQIRSRKFAGTKSTSKKSSSISFPQICGNEIYLQKNSIPKKITFKFVPANLRERNPPPKKFHSKKITFKFVPANLRERNSPQKNHL
ncbi:hypothetical protein DFH07DRAFT_766844 [Mycena maculata]|uniref:Uncharacterized protein n=1 Tax=Mycena maculata TaxID=230809 RepID=A0AAD7NUP6_9AGAR|nr:hypothetical protein DFH07DRAFT_766844 [Mycena maculata]